MDEYTKGRVAELQSVLKLIPHKSPYDPGAPNGGTAYHDGVIRGLFNFSEVIRKRIIAIKDAEACNRALRYYKAVYWGLTLKGGVYSIYYETSTDIYHTALDGVCCPKGFIKVSSKVKLSKYDPHNDKDINLYFDADDFAFHMVRMCGVDVPTT